MACDLPFEELLKALSAEHLRLLKQVHELAEENELLRHRRPSHKSEVTVQSCPSDHCCRQVVDKKVHELTEENEGHRHRRPSHKSEVTVQSCPSDHTCRPVAEKKKQSRSYDSFMLQGEPSSYSPNFHIFPYYTRERAESKQSCLSRVVRSNAFDIICAAVITCNAALLAVEADQQARYDHPSSMPVFEYASWFFTSFFILELLLRMASYGPLYFFLGPSWHFNSFDFVVVMTDIAERLIGFLSSGQGSIPRNLSVIRVLRVLRLARAIRIVRLLRFFKELRVMVFSILCCARPLLWAMLLVLVVIFVFGIYLTQIVTYHRKMPNVDEADLIFLNDHFGSLLRTSATLFQSVAGGLEWGPASTRLGEMHWSNSLLFNFYIFFTMFALLNIITGVFVDAALASARNDFDELIQEELSSEESSVRTLQKLFEERDLEKTGQISADQLKVHMKDLRVRAQLRAMDIEIKRVHGLFDLLDIEKSGSLSIHEFVFGLIRLKGNARAIDLATLMYENKRLATQWASYIEGALRHHEMQKKVLFRIDDNVDELTGPPACEARAAQIPLFCHAGMQSL